MSTKATPKGEGEFAYMSAAILLDGPHQVETLALFRDDHQIWPEAATIAPESSRPVFPQIGGHCLLRDEADLAAWLKLNRCSDKTPPCEFPAFARCESNDMGDCWPEYLTANDIYVMFYGLSELQSMVGSTKPQ